MSIEREISTEDEPTIGSPVTRREDRPLLTGQAEYTDDASAPGMAHAAILRSQYGHARIEEVDTSEAEALDGVVGVFTGADVAASDAPGYIPAWVFPPDSEADPAFSVETETREPDRPMIAEDVVRYTGEPVAVAVAEDRYTAEDAIDRIEVEYDRLDAVMDPVDSVESETTALHEDAPDNLALEWEVGDEGDADAAFEDADTVIEADVVNQRLAPNAMETRAALARYKPSSGELTVRLSSQVPHHHRSMLSTALDVPEHRVRVIAPDVGGGFGLKSKFHNGEAIAGWCAVELERPVKWRASRTEGFASDIHGRGHDTTGELAVDDDGTIRGLRVDTYVDMGAYLSKVSPFIATAAYARVLSNMYDIPAIHGRVVGAFTNKAPMDAYRGAGRPEAAYAVERLIRQAAAELDMDPVEFRRRNLIDPDDFPHRTPVGVSYDSGNYEETMEKALDLVGYDDLRERQAEAREEGRYLGIGLGCYVETAAGIDIESSLVRFHPSGKVTAFTGTHDHGQGHNTTFSQVLADRLGVDYDDIEVREGDTDQIPKGTGTYGSRSTVSAGTALVESAEKVIEEARKIAAHKLEAPQDDVEFAEGEFYVTGAPDRSIHIQDVASMAYGDPDIPDDVEPGLEASSFVRTDLTFPYGIHVAVVEVDPDSGEIELERYLGVDDVGNQINPMIVEGQVHGGVAQGIGQALYEGVEYDDTGTLVNGSLQDYAVPKAEHLPDLETDSTVTPAPDNPLGVKGVGEAGTVAAPPAVVNAVMDAVEPFGVEHLDMPLTSEKLWRAIRDGE